MNFTEDVMTIIAYSGEAKSFALKAIQLARKKDFTGAEEALKKCQDNLETAHKSSSGLLVQEAQENDVVVSLLMVHALDHFSNAEVTQEIAQELVYLHEEIN
jgi:PTS system cellobiose-specific IIA component